MNNQDFSVSFLVDQKPQQAYEAINNVRGWWAGEIEGSTDKLNDEFTYSYPPYHYSKHKLVEMVPGKKIVWLITDSSLNFIEDKTEWNGTKISFDIAEKGGKTKSGLRIMGWCLRTNALMRAQTPGQATLPTASAT